jgi:hypothetical protein
VRAAQIAAAAGLSTDKAKVEGLRSKLKRAGPLGFQPGGLESMPLTVS